MQIMGGKEQKEGIFFIFLYPFFRFFHPFVSQVLIPKTGGMTACIKTDSADTVVNGRVVTVRPIHL